MITIVKAEISDFKIIREIALKTWPIAYGKILSEAQMEYMLELLYSEKALQENVLTQNHHYLLAKENTIPIGFASYQNNYNQKNATKIHKLYVLPTIQNKGIGKKLVDAIEKLAIENQSESLCLNVNRFNIALGFYQKMGFFISREEDIAIGQGYLMEDYVLEKLFN